MSEINRDDQRKPQRRAAQQRIRVNGETRPMPQASARTERMDRASAPTRRRVVQGEPAPTERQRLRRTSEQQGEMRPRRADRSGEQPARRRAPQGAPVAGERRQPQQRRVSDSAATTKIPRQRRVPTEDEIARRAAGEGAPQGRPARRRPEGERPVRPNAGQPRRRPRPTQGRPDGRPARPEARTKPSSKQSVIAASGDEFSIENVAPAHRGQVARWREWTTRGFAGIMAIGLIIGLLFFARPTVSTVENRTLTTFPEFSIEGVMDGSFFSGVSTWYADTYPLREPLVSLDQWLEGFFGIKTDTMMVGGSTASQDIPENGQAQNPGAASAESAANRVVEAPSTEAMSDEIQNSIMDGLYIKNGAAYSRYYFVQESAETYASALNLAADRLAGTTKVYSILIPNNSGALLSQEELTQLGGADQGKAIAYFGSLYSDKVTQIEAYDTLRSHNSEYLYFRTDHHWTTQGAYYVYRNLCAATGKTPTELSSLRSDTFQPFLGSFYGQLGLDSMAANPDYVTAYYPNGTNDMTFWDDDGNEVPYHVITDVSEWADSSKYGAFIGGDKSLSIIENPALSDGSSCLLVKDSYGCAFAPFLVDNYQTVYIIDFRYFTGNIVDFCKEKGVNDLIFLNNITMATASSVGEAILSEVQ